jgi:NAD(P)-dependent dehydrogenase (short-subunit alcohol dehydrogenase family)
MELGPLGVRVLALQPGHIASDFGATAGALADRDWSGSRYAPVRDAIADRAGASQHNATPAADFAREAVDHILSPRPRAVATFGRGGRPLVVLARFVPAALRDRLLTRRFRLGDLAAAQPPTRAPR